MTACSLPFCEWPYNAWRASRQTIQSPIYSSRRMTPAGQKILWFQEDKTKKRRWRRRRPNKTKNQEMTSLITMGETSKAMDLSIVSDLKSVLTKVLSDYEKAPHANSWIFTRRLLPNFRLPVWMLADKTQTRCLRLW